MKTLGRLSPEERSLAGKRLNETILHSLRDGGLPMRDKYVGDILHFKMMLFHGQNVVEFSKAAWTAPVSNDPVTITFKQRVNATDPLRTGAYSKTLTFTLSTTSP